MITNPALICDFYKISHREQSPNKTEKIYSTWTARKNAHHSSVDYVVAFGFQGFIVEYLMHYFNENFFFRDKTDIVEEYKRLIKYTLGVENPDATHIEDLWDLGYLPIEIRAIQEGTKVPIRVPMMSIENTDPRFFWLTNYLETLISNELWLPMTSATIAYEYRLLLNYWARKTGSDKELVQFQAHDFSMRGLSSLESSIHSGAAHLTSFTGTDVIPAVMYLEEYYGADIEKELVGCSIPATEHSVMCAGGMEDEYDTYKRLITEVYPSGMISIVSDTWDLWNTITNILPSLKDEIMARDGKVVIRPDSGDPVDIICGKLRNPNSTARFNDEYTPEDKGVIQLLWDIFGGTINEKGYKVLDPHIGAIYGDAITLQRAETILTKLEQMGFCSSNIVFGVGSYTYQYNTRDTFGFAMKSTFAVVDGKGHQLYKDPVTDNGVKKSQKGKVVVNEDLTFTDNTFDDTGTILEVIFKNGEEYNLQTLQEVRDVLVSTN